MKQVIIVKEIRNTKNAQVKQLMLTTTIEKPATANPVSFFLKGVPKVAPATEKRTFFQSISTDVIAEHGIKEGSDFHKVFPQFPNARLAVRETFTQRTWEGGEQAPKINPQTGVVMQKGGKDIYRNVELSLDGTLEDFYIQHDPVNAPSTGNPFAGMKGESIEELAKGGSVVAEPALPGA